MVWCELVPLVDAHGPPDDALAVSNGYVPLFWLTLFDADDLRSSTGGPVITTSAMAAARSRQTLERLVEERPGSYDSLASTWLRYIETLPVEGFALKVRPGAALSGIDLATQRSAWPDGLPRHPGAGDEPDVAERLCGLPHFRPVPWPVPERAAGPTVDGSRRAPTIHPREIARPDLRPARHREVRLVTPLTPGDPSIGTNAPREPLHMSWLVSGPLLMAGLLYFSLAVPPVRGRPPAEDIQGIALLGLVAAAGSVRARWPLTALLVTTATTVLHTALGYGITSLALGTLLGAVTVARRSIWWQALPAVAVATAGLLAAIGLSGEAQKGDVPGVVLVGLLAALLGALVRHLRASDDAVVLVPD